MKTEAPNSENVFTALYRMPEKDDYQFWISQNPHPVADPTYGDGWMEYQGIVYPTVKIGEQVWMAENLRALRDRDGRAFLVASGLDWSYYTPLLYNVGRFYTGFTDRGFLYNWAAALRVCPKGWHLPTLEEVEVLLDYCRKNYGLSTGKALASSKEWHGSPKEDAIGYDTQKNNLSGFAALPSGYFGLITQGLGTDAAFWCIPKDFKTYSFNLNYDFGNVILGRTAEFSALSIRCIKD